MWGKAFQAEGTEHAKAWHSLVVRGTPSSLLERNHEGRGEREGNDCGSFPPGRQGSTPRFWTELHTLSNELTI